MIRSLCLAALAALLLSGCQSTPDVSTDYNPGYSFAGKTAFAVMRPEKAFAAMGKEAPRTGMNDLMAERLTHTLEKALESRGYRIVPPAQADMVVTFVVMAQNKTQITSYNTGWGYARCWRCAGGPWVGPQEVDVKNYVEGTLIVDFIDTAKRELVWRGSSSKRLPSKASPKERDKLATEIVGNILSQYPPGTAP